MSANKNNVRRIAIGLLAVLLATGTSWAEPARDGRDGGGHDSGGRDSGGRDGGRGDRDGGRSGPSSQGRSQGSPDRGPTQTFSNSNRSNDRADRDQNRSNGQQRDSFYRGPDTQGPSARDDRNNRDSRDSNANRQQLNTFLNGRGDNNQAREGDFRRRFTDRDQQDVNGTRFRGNADAIRRDWKNHDRNDFPFAVGWWNDNRFTRWPVYSPWRYSYYRDRPWYWWRVADAAALGSWLVFDWNRPYYWDYGPNGYIYYSNNQIYQNGQPYMAGQAYYQQVYALAHSAPNISEDQAAKLEWMPLGAFAVTNEGRADSNRIMQLAVTKEGVISGTYFNQQANESHPLQGMVDQKTQRAAWAFADGSNDRLVMETSIYNLTEPQSTMMVHFGPNEVATRQLVRLEQPDSAGKSQPNPIGNAPRADLP